MSFILISIGIALFIVAVTTFVYRKKTSSTSSSGQDMTPSTTTTTATTTSSKNEIVNKNSVSKKVSSSSSSSSSSGSNSSNNHSLYIGSLKGHTEDITQIEFTSDGLFLVSSSKDRTLRCWNNTSFSDKSNKHFRANVELDYISSFSLSQDSKFVISSLNASKKLQVYKISKNSGLSVGPTIDINPPSLNLPAGVEILNIKLSGNGKIVACCFSNTQLSLFDPKGRLLDTLDTKLMYNLGCSISPDSKFIAVWGFAPVPHIYDLSFSSTGEFIKCGKAMDLPGHRGSIYSVTFSSDSTKALTVSKDGTWQVWNIDVRYALKEDPKLLSSGKFEFSSTASFSPQGCISPDGLVVVITHGSVIQFFDISTGAAQETIEKGHGGDIFAVAFHPSSKTIATVGLDGHVSAKEIKLWNNIAGVRAVKRELQEKLSSQKNELVKQRLVEQIADCDKELQEYIRKSG